jgi:hypothetical protein
MFWFMCGRLLVLGKRQKVQAAKDDGKAEGGELACAVAVG